ncbi:rRNA adenine methyltransferase [Limnospira fusiformis CCALA 023]|uniref:class II aldolase/adducin family protein n=1 Tax=Oscillatoriales TaxID=1150 RepID=UPI00396EFD63
MTMIDEGVIKYQCNWIEAEPLASPVLAELMYWRDRLYSLGLIGVYDNGIGFGNISVRLGNSGEFIITGTQTGHLAHLTPKHYTLVSDFSWQENWITCRGPIKASSEALTHAAIYSHQPQIKAIAHVHNPQIWQQLMFKVPTTNPNVPYGTPQMAEEMFRLFAVENLADHQILVMGGHQDGFLSFGQNLTEAGEILLQSVNIYPTT